MDKTFNSHNPLPTDPVKRVESVVAVCIAVGYVNRDVLAQYYGLTPLHASILLREFLQRHTHDVRRDSASGGYVLLGYPSRLHAGKHSSTH